MKQVAPLRYDVIFKKAFCVPEIFTAFVRDFVGIEIDTVEKDKACEPAIGNVVTKFDLYAEDKKNRIIVNIEHEGYLVDESHYTRPEIQRLFKLIGKDKVTSQERAKMFD